ncbi:hypothetical protein EDD90_5075 [Streptomyces sp. Ag109_O5-1]|uniref:hypothetical protein n=1 Tax=Streptomyces sp. Ag109_O5-1 TaxID=1938851 RepID=UPI000F4F9A80|nr:hypothetical protein [Streptomyces sp. Ag109_O5-1]RPE41975.1 hypothetical protein EDD90_5075 [Streptomyces sp. Ag109_O5-1]
MQPLTGLHLPVEHKGGHVMGCSCTGEDIVLRSQGEALFRRAGLTDIAQHVMQIDAEISGGHKRLRYEERAAALGFPFNRGAAVPPEVFFQRAKRHAQQARLGLRSAFASDEWTAIRNSFSHDGDEFAQSLGELRGAFLEAVNNADVPVADSREIANAFDRVADISRQGGIDGLLPFFDEQFSQFDEILTTERNWGREGHSPLEWWQWLIIIGVLVISVAALIACLLWFGCSWISAIWVAFCSGTSAAAGGFWAGICIGFGF